MRYETFWLVWNERGSVPTVKHTSELSARDEAERLARHVPGVAFHVLRVIGTVVKNDVLWLDTSAADRAYDESCPF